jgi:Spy/CpxP family protein refolding chaperone
MRRLCKTIVALGLVALMAGPAMAQQGRGGRGGFFGGGLGMLLTNASVQQELKLDATQTEKVKEVAEKAREKFQAKRESLEGLHGEERFKKLQEFNKEVNAGVDKEIKEFLSTEQIHRLHQIQHQLQGAHAFTDEHVQDKLKLTDDQKTEIHEIVHASKAETHKIWEDAQGDREAMMAKMAEHRKETLAKVESKLTDEQKTAWKEMLGAPFEIKWERHGHGH